MNTAIYRVSMYGHTASQYGNEQAQLTDEIVEIDIHELEGCLDSKPIFVLDDLNGPTNAFPHLLELLDHCHWTDLGGSIRYMGSHPGSTDLLGTESYSPDAKRLCFRQPARTTGCHRM